jgi:hypothetical protein
MPVKNGGLGMRNRHKRDTVNGRVEALALAAVFTKGAEWDHYGEG